MMHPSMIRSIRPAADVLLGLLGLALIAGVSGCDSMADNRLLDSVHQPVVAHSQYQLDLATGPGGLGPDNASRLDGWFDALGLRYGDRIGIDDPLGSAQTRAEVKMVAARYGMLVDPGVPITQRSGTQGLVIAGTVRISVTRATASVPHCPDLTTRSETNFKNATSSNYGCAVNSNLAAMVANPDDLISGTHGRTLTTVDTADKAIWLRQAAIPTGQASVTKNTTN